MEAQGDVEALHKSLRVERNIRHDLERACQARGLGSLVHTFEGQVSMSSPRPGAKTPLRRGSAVPEPVGNVPVRERRGTFCSDRDPILQLYI